MTEEEGVGEEDEEGSSRVQGKKNQRRRGGRLHQRYRVYALDACEFMLMSWVFMESAGP